MLDGLTIGSDHCFGMSLCCGNGSGGEGEGAIAEIAVFHGRLDLLDLQVLERQMMKRHGIPSVGSSCCSAKDQDRVTATATNLRQEQVRKENDWVRLAHALFLLPPSSEDELQQQQQQTQKQRSTIAFPYSSSISGMATKQPSHR